jgi:hypothetical protein
LEMLLFINLNHIFLLFTPHILLFFRLESIFPSVRSNFFFSQFDFFVRTCLSKELRASGVGVQTIMIPIFLGVEIIKLDWLRHENLDFRYY